MRVRRLLAAIVTTGLIAPTAVIVASSTTPASAATATQITGGSSGWLDTQTSYSQPGPVVTGSNIYISAKVTDAAGTSVYEGTLTIQRLIQGTSTWQTVATSRADSPYVYETIKATTSSTFRAIYSGSANYTPSSLSAAVPVQRKLTTKSIYGKKVGFKGRLSPKAKTKITVQRKVGKKWKKFKKLRTSAKGKFTVILPAPSRKKTYWRITFKGSKGYASTKLVYWTRRY